MKHPPKSTMQIQPRCRDCGSERFVWDWSAGDILCYHCGLVHQERFFDDRPSFGEYFEVYDEEDHNTHNTSTHKSITQCITPCIQECLGQIADTTNIMKEISSVETKNKSKQAVAIYTTLKKEGVTAAQVCSTMNISESKLWHAMDKTQGKSNTTNEPEPSKITFNTIKRFVYSSTIIPNDFHWEVIKQAVKINEILSTESNIIRFQTIKKDKLIVSMVFVAMKIVAAAHTQENKKTFPSNQAFSKHFKISHTTLQKHEHIILGHIG